MVRVGLGEALGERPASVAAMPCPAARRRLRARTGTGRRPGATAVPASGGVLVVGSPVAPVSGVCAKAGAVAITKARARERRIRFTPLRAPDLRLRRYESHLPQL